VAFFPLYPLLVHLGTAIGLPSELAAMGITSLAFLGASFYLYRLVEEAWGAPAALRAVWIVAFFPTSFFTFAPYTESLYLLCAAGALYHARHLQGWRAGLWGAGAALSHATGLALLPAMLLCWKGNRLQAVPRLLGPTAAAGAAYLGYLNAQHVAVSTLLGAERGWHRALTFPWTGFQASLEWLVQAGSRNPAWAAENLLQLAVTVIFLVLTALAWRHLGGMAAAYCGIFWVALLVSPEWLDRYYAPFSSMDRLVLGLFPLAGWAASRVTGARFRVLVAASALIMLGAAAVHTFGGWVG
jgi:Gpi18-like mannosyltransferase